MYKVNKGRLGNYESYILVDENSGSKVTVIPERGGIISGFEVDNQNVLYLDMETFNDPAKNIRGGNPVLFPTCGLTENNSYEYEGKKYSIGNHGLVRSYPWNVEDTLTEDGAGIIISITSNDEMKEKYPFDFEIVYKYILKGSTITIEQSYKNKSNKPMPMYAGFHPYFNVSGRNAVEYGINATKLWDTREKSILDYNGKIEFPDEDTSKIILDAKGNSLWFYDEKLKRKISMEYGEDFKYIVIWSVKGKDFVCVEPWMAMANAMNTGKNLHIIQPGEILNEQFSINCSHI
jgi:galactose mutarotase-like enzyme